MTLPISCGVTPSEKGESGSSGIGFCLTLNLKEDQRLLVDSSLSVWVD